MIVAAFEREDEAVGLRDLLRDVGGVEAGVFGDRGGWIVEVLAPAELCALVIHYLYYIKGVAIEQVPELSREARIDVLVQAMARLALETRKWRPTRCNWYVARAGLDEADVTRASEMAEAEYQAHRRGALRKLFRR